jgi:redox-sensitive bicupin YhaK (pirin superfamily)
MGNSGVIGPGDVQWMTAARGVIHEEFHGGQFTKSGGTFEVVQLWVNLPAKLKMSPPGYQEILASQIPRVALADHAGEVRVIAGEFQGTKGPARTFTPVDLWDLRLKAGHRIELTAPEGRTAILVVQRGEIAINDSQSAAAVALVLFDRAGEGVAVEARTDVMALFLGGEPIDEPVVGYGPFVMNTPEEIQQAIADYQGGRMGRLS